MTATAAEKTRPAIRAAQIDLFGLDGALLVSAGIILGADAPEIVMWNGDPFLRDERIGPNAYRQIRPYRLDQGA
jgi:hypothetical protein